METQAAATTAVETVAATLATLRCLLRQKLQWCRVRLKSGRGGGRSGYSIGCGSNSGNGNTDNNGNGGGEQQSTKMTVAAAAMAIVVCKNRGSRLVLILAGAVCYIFICFWYISTVS